MPAKHQYVDIEIPKDLKKDDRESIAEEIKARIIKRTQSSNVDKNGRSFPKYSESYKNSAAFKDAGKSSRVNLTLNDEMLNAMETLKTSPGNIRIGFERGSDENAKADGNIRGTYGQSSPIKGKARDFLGISKGDLNKILKKYE